MAWRIWSTAFPTLRTTVFPIASISKQFTAAAIVLLALDGKLSLDDPVSKYIPEMPDFGAPVTIRHLVHHTQRPERSMVAVEACGLAILAGPDHR